MKENSFLLVISIVNTSQFVFLILCLTEGLVFTVKFKAVFLNDI